MWKYWWNKKAMSRDEEIDSFDTSLKLPERVSSVEDMIHMSPTITNEVEECADILENAFKMDATVEEACILAWISPSTYYKRINQDATLKRRMELAKDWSKMIAHAAIYNKMRKGDAKIALQFLKLRDKRYKDVTIWWAVEWEDWKAPIVQFISVDTNKWQKSTTSPDEQMDTEQKLSSEWYVNIWENSVEKKTNWENEEQVLRNIDLWASNNE